MSYAEDLLFPPPWKCWVVYNYDVGPYVVALFPTEIEALRFATERGHCDRVMEVGAGDLSGVLV